MLRQSLWLVFDVVVGLLLTGVVSPVVLSQLPARFRGAAALWGVALVSVVLVALGRRALGVGAVRKV